MRTFAGMRTFAVANLQSEAARKPEIDRFKCYINETG